MLFIYNEFEWFVEIFMAFCDINCIIQFSAFSFRAMEELNLEKIQNNNEKNIYETNMKTWTHMNDSQEKGEEEEEKKTPITTHRMAVMATKNQ